jgi:hypothetical protein
MVYRNPSKRLRFSVSWDLMTYRLQIIGASVDGDVTFDVSESHLLSAASGAASESVQLKRESPAGVFRKGWDSSNPIAGLLRLWVSAAAVILCTCAAGWLGHLFLTPKQSLAQAMPDLVAILVFFLIARLR